MALINKNNFLTYFPVIDIFLEFGMFSFSLFHFHVNVDTTAESSKIYEHFGSKRIYLIS